MGVLGELFVGTHSLALERAGVLDAGEIPSGAVPHIDLTQIGALDLEILGEVAAREVRFGTGDLEVAEIDLAHDNLFGLPPFLTEVLAAVRESEDEDVVGDIARSWADDAEIDASTADLERVIDAIVGLAVQATERGERLYLWTRSV
ncbi:hypothetical protein N866_19265 [Actinotalea ferrariae CF5-4]|uniref:Uncharacterized protein n=1 Tax=Actinotalea ferrariae CF5-4 TaxID=948458 RepID=A0A021VR70_9CELL|nr:hypothetical protein [Actinotalea ferrariae]EYR63636.1 hypothetical protein N866_19265 [Actinotalea ferrariae CF5-4]